MAKTTHAELCTKDMPCTDCIAARTCVDCERFVPLDEPLFIDMRTDGGARCQDCQVGDEEKVMDQDYECIQVPRAECDKWAGLQWSEVVAAALADKIPDAILMRTIPKHVAPPETAFLANRGIASVRSQGW